MRFTLESALEDVAKAVTDLLKGETQVSLEHSTANGRLKKIYVVKVER
jgi:hypothetical protein